MAIELNRQGIDSSPKCTYTGGEVAGLQMLYSFCLRKFVYHVPNLRIKIPYSRLTGIGRARWLK